MKIGIVAKPHQTQFDLHLKDLLAWLQDHNCEAIVEEEVVQAFALTQVKGTLLENIPAQADLIMVFGGDGTMLRVARSIEGRPAPILGVNLGSLGFLTEITLEDLYPALERVLEGKYAIDRRNMLKVSIHRGGHPVATHHALNDAVINTGALARLISMDAFVDEEYIATFPADGMIISTPTGSTAYSLSAGGPVLCPQLDSVVMTPICSHTLTSRPLVIPAESNIRVVVKSGEEVMLTVDGQIGVPLGAGDEVCCTRSEYQIELVQAGHKDFFDVLREKLKWGER
jgi:NAD+ kinase